MANRQIAEDTLYPGGLGALAISILCCLSL